MVASISVIIPALNEADLIEATIECVLCQSGRAEVLVVDGGSKDATVELAQRQVRVISAARGRAHQMNAGAASATGDVFVFLHADTLLPENGLQVIRDVLADPKALGGCFQTTFDDDSFWMRVWSWKLWMKWPALAFGDRALFVRRSIFEEVGGFPAQPLFEDLEIVQRIRRKGNFVFMNEAVKTSARRFVQHGRLRQQLYNSVLWIGWLSGVPAARLRRFYSYGADKRGVVPQWRGDPQTEAVGR